MDDKTDNKFYKRGVRRTVNWQKLNLKLRDRMYKEDELKDDNKDRRDNTFESDIGAICEEFVAGERRLLENDKAKENSNATPKESPDKDST